MPWWSKPGTDLPPMPYTPYTRKPDESILQPGPRQRAAELADAYLAVGIGATFRMQAKAAALGASFIRGGQGVGEGEPLTAKWIAEFIAELKRESF